MPLQLPEHLAEKIAAFEAVISQVIVTGRMVHLNGSPGGLVRVNAGGSIAEHARTPGPPVAMSGYGDCEKLLACLTASVA